MSERTKALTWQGICIPGVGILCTCAGQGCWITPIRFSVLKCKVLVLSNNHWCSGAVCMYLLWFNGLWYKQVCLTLQKNILGLMKAFPGKITCCFHVTQQHSQICEELQPHITGKCHGIVQRCCLKPKFEYILQDEVVHNNPAFLHLKVQNEMWVKQFLYFLCSAEKFFFAGFVFLS